MFEYAISAEGREFIAGWVGVLMTMIGAWMTLRNIRLIGSNNAAIADMARKKASTGGWLAFGAGVVWLLKVTILS